MEGYDNHMAVNTETQKEYVILQKTFQNTCNKYHIRMVVLIKVTVENWPVSGIELIVILIYRTSRT